MQVEPAIDERGRQVAVKQAETPDDAARLRREADLLEVAAHPGLIEVVRWEDGAEARLHTIWVGGPSLAQVRPLDVEEVAGVVAAAACTLADLHAAGLVHGSVEASHVVLDEDGRPVLCGLGSGGLAGERCGEEAVLEPASDVAGLGAVLEHLLSRVTGRLRGAGAEALRHLAGLACGPVETRPSARSLADAIHDAVPGARLPRPEGEPPTRPAEPPAPVRPSLEALRRPVAARPPRGLRLAGVGVATAVVVGVAVVALGGQARPASPPEGVASASPSTSTPPAPFPEVAGTPPSPPATAPRPAVPAGCPAVEGPLTADVDGDGCAEAVTFTAGVVEAAGRRWAVGQEGDVVALGDWACSGVRSLAVLRPSTGDVYAFSSWASAEAEARAPVVSRVAGGQALRSADLDGDGCNELVVERASGAPAVLHPRRGTP
ncbi:MAG: hypothetical protein ACLGI2_02675 [Acidimicrobiia bacterium]